MTVIPITAISMIASYATNSGIQILEAVRRFIVSFSDRLYNRIAQPIEGRGEARGIARALDWAQRKAKAESQGLPFDEPPPEAPPHK